MNIKYHSLLTITPIFFIIAIVISILNYNNNKDEIIWKIHEEAKSIIIGSSVFIDNIVSDSTIIQKKDKILLHLNRIKRYKQTKEFYIIDNNSNLILTTERNATLQTIKQRSVEIEDADITISKIYKQDNINYLNVTANITIDNQKVAQIVAKLYADSTIKDLDNLLYTLLITIIIITLIGVILSLVISNIVINRIKILKDIASSIAKGNYHIQSDSLDIREFKDLEDTLNTMKSIMREILFKAKNSIMGQEQLNLNDDLGIIYNQKYISSKIEIYDDIEIAIKIVGNQTVDTIFNIVSTQKKIFCFMGKIKPQESSIDSAIDANKTSYYLSKSLIYHPLNQIHNLVEDFNIHKLSIIEIEKSTLFANIHEIGKDGTRSKELKINKEKVVYFHTLKQNIYEELDIYIKNYSFLNLNDTCSDIDIIFKENHNGLVLLIKMS